MRINLLVLCLALVAIGCRGNEDSVDVPVLGNGADYQVALKTAEELSSAPLAKFANDEELTEEEKRVARTAFENSGLKLA